MKSQFSVLGWFDNYGDPYLEEFDGDVPQNAAPDPATKTPWPEKPPQGNPAPSAPEFSPLEEAEEMEEQVDYDPDDGQGSETEKAISDQEEPTCEGNDPSVDSVENTRSPNGAARWHASVGQQPAPSSSASMNQEEEGISSEPSDENDLDWDGDQGKEWVVHEPPPRPQGQEKEAVRSYDEAVKQAVLHSEHPGKFLPEIPHPLRQQHEGICLDSLPMDDLLSDCSTKAEWEPQTKEVILPSVEDGATNRERTGGTGHLVNHETRMPVGCATARVADGKGDCPKTSLQLSYAAYNLGNLRRGAVPKDGSQYKKRRTEQGEVTEVPYLSLVFDGFSHIVLLCEAAEMLKMPKMRQAVGQHGHKAMFSRCGNMAVLARAENVSGC